MDREIAEVDVTLDSRKADLWQGKGGKESLPSMGGAGRKGTGARCSRENIFVSPLYPILVSAPYPAGVSSYKLVKLI